MSFDFPPKKEAQDILQELEKFQKIASLEYIINHMAHLAKYVNIKDDNVYKDRLTEFPHLLYQEGYTQHVVEDAFMHLRRTCEWYPAYSIVYGTCEFYKNNDYITKTIRRCQYFIDKIDEVNKAKKAKKINDANKKAETIFIKKYTVRNSIIEILTKGKQKEKDYMINKIKEIKNEILKEQELKNDVPDNV